MHPLCLVIGAGLGVGQAVARRFAREGYAVALLSRHADRLAPAVAELAALGVPAAAYAADVADSLALTAARVAAQQAYGPAAVLVYNAAAASPGPPSVVDPEQLVHDFQVSVAGALTAAQQVLPAMRQAGRGTLLFTGGGLADHPSHHAFTLSMGKAGLRLLASLLHQELAGTPLRVGAVTIRGRVQPGTAFDPDRIAEAYWQLHNGDNQPLEISFDGAA